MNQDTVRSLAQLDESFRPVVVGVRATVNHLKEWTDGFPASTSGALSGSAMVDLDADPTNPDLVDNGKPHVDRAAVKIALIFDLVDQLVVLVGELGELVPGDRVVYPSSRLEARVAFVQWQINRVRAAHELVTLPTAPLSKAAGLADHLHRLVTVNAPAKLPGGVPAGGCSSHARAGEWAEIDDRYRRHDLCRRCGEFKHLYRQLPPPKLVRWAEKHGWTSAKAPSTLARFAVKAPPVRRGA